MLLIFFCIVSPISQEFFCHLTLFHTCVYSDYFVAYRNFFSISSFLCQIPCPYPQPSAPLGGFLRFLQGFYFSLEPSFHIWLVGRDVSQSHFIYIIAWKNVLKVLVNWCHYSLLQMIAQYLFTFLCFHKVWVEEVLRVWTSKHILTRTAQQNPSPSLCRPQGVIVGVKPLIVLIPTEAPLPAQGSTSSFGSPPHKALDGPREDIGCLPGSTHALAPWLIWPFVIQVKFWILARIIIRFL